MTSLYTQSTIFPQFDPTDELNSKLFWANSTTNSPLQGETLHLFEGAATTLGSSTTDHLLSPFEDTHLSPPFTQSGDGERVDFWDFTTNVYNISLGSTVPAHTSYFDHTPQASSSTIVSPPSTCPSIFSRSFDNSESDGYSDFVFSSDAEHHPPQSTSCRKREKGISVPSSSHYAPFSHMSFTTEPEKSNTGSRRARRSHPYRSDIPSRNFQSEDPASLIDKGSEFRCPIVCCDYVQENQRNLDLKRHIKTHERWREPGKWTCCGVGVDRAHLYGKSIKQGMTYEECIAAGAYTFKGRLMIGGCMKTFSRRDSLKRHVDNPKFPCVGHMNSYNF